MTQGSADTGLEQVIGLIARYDAISPLLFCGP